MSHVVETWSFGGYINIESGYGLTLKTSGNEIKIADNNTGNTNKPLKDYPIKWSAINGKPSGSYVNSVTASNAVSGGNWYPGNRALPGIYFYTGVSGNNLIAFVCNDSEDVWGWYYDLNGNKVTLPESSLQNGTNLVELAVYKYIFNTRNF